MGLTGQERQAGGSAARNRQETICMSGKAMRKKPSLQKPLQQMFGPASILLLLFGCTAPAPVSTSATAAPILISAPTSPPTDDARGDGLSDEQVATLGSLKKIDDYPLYTMHYYGAYDRTWVRDRGSESLAMGDLPNPELGGLSRASACSLFAALGDADNFLLGRNFDWEYSPAVLLFTNPVDGYASVSMVDIAYLGFGGVNAGTLTDLPLIEREALLNTPFLPFDGMNEHGLAVGMAAVPPGEMVPDPAKETVGSLMVIRKILDQAKDIDEAVAILQSHNIDMEGGPSIHYLIAAPSGRSVLLEFYQGEMVVIPNERTWHLATNFLRASINGSAEGVCRRYDSINAQLTETEGWLSVQGAMDLLAEVSQEETQWSVVYGMSTGDVKVVMGRQYDNLYTFPLSFAGE
jgi:hypothetical protein